MIDTLLIIPLMTSFLLTLFILPFWIRKAKQVGLVWEDMNKYKSEKVAGSGGIMVVISFVIGVFTYIAYKVFYLKTADGFLVQIFASLTVILLLAGFGFIDDLLGWQRGGLSKKYRILLVAIAAIPLMVINAGKSDMALPFIGSVDLGVIYPLFFIPLGIL